MKDISRNQITVLSGREIRQLATMREAIGWMSDAFRHLSAGRVNVPLRIRMEFPQSAANMLIMPVAAPDIPVVAVKAVSIFRKNAEHNLPLIHSLLQVFDAKNGKPLALLDGEYITALRTGAASGLATKLLARKNANCVVIFGTGVQGQMQLRAIAEVRSLKKAYLINRSGKQLRETCEKLSRETGIEVRPGTVGNMSEADIICTATTSQEPLFADRLLKPGVHINSIGAYKPELREIPLETLARAKILVGSRKACLAEDGDITHGLQSSRLTSDCIFAEIGQLVAENCPGRTSADEITVFKSVGNAVQDIWTVHQVLQKAFRQKVGRKVEI